MKWNVEEANPKTGHYRTLTVDAPDQEAAEVLGRFMGLKDGEVKPAPLPGKSASAGSVEANTPPARRLATHWIVLLTASATVVFTVAGIKVMKPLLKSHNTDSASTAGMSTDVADMDQTNLGPADGDKQTLEVAPGSNAGAEPDFTSTSSDAKDPGEQPALDLLPSD